MRKLIAAAALLTLMGAGCMSTAPQAQPTPTPEVQPTPTPTPTPTPKPTTKKPAPVTVTVQIQDWAFSPQVMAITVGDTVVWKNVGKVNHTVMGVDSSLLWDSGNLKPGQTYSRTFTSAATYDYRDNSHSTTTGQIVVHEAE